MDINIDYRECKLIFSFYITLLFAQEDEWDTDLAVSCSAEYQANNPLRPVLFFDGIKKVRLLRLYEPSKHKYHRCRPAPSSLKSHHMLCCKRHSSAVCRLALCRLD